MTITKININAFAGTFAFLPTLEPNQKKQKSLQANAQGQCKIWTTDLRLKRTTTDNMGLASCGVTCLNSSAVFQINFSAWLTVLCPEIPHERQARKPLCAIVMRRLKIFMSEAL